MKKLFTIAALTCLGFMQAQNDVKVFATAENTSLKLSALPTLSWQNFQQPLETQMCVFVNSDKTFQTFLGVGGAITDASAEVFAKMPKDLQNQFLNAYYSKSEGIAYNIIRTNIHSCDFSSDSYTYVKEGDKELKSFNIKHDLNFKIPLMQKALAISGKNTTVYASPWSPPAFMKSTNNMLKGGFLKPEFYQSWANYYVKFIQEYEKIGIPIWGITVQNEPMATQTWESCIYSAENERDFVKNFLGPTMEKNGFSDKKITIWDHNRDLLPQRASTVLLDKEAAKYVWGVGFHWYENWSGGEPMFDNVAKVNQMFPDKNLLFTEGCNEKFDINKLNFWPNAERYGKAMINDFNNGTVGWTDWNILLDEKGGPNHVGNFCFAPVHFNTQSKELVFTPSFYYIGHFSKFIQKDAKRIQTSVSRSQLIATSFVNPDNQKVTVIMNDKDQAFDFWLCLDNQKMTKVNIAPKSILTLTY